MGCAVRRIVARSWRNWDADTLKKHLEKHRQGFAARQAARNRLPKWAVYAQLAIQISSLAGFMLAWVIGFSDLYGRFHPADPHPANSVGLMLILFGAIAFTIPTSLIWTNAILWTIPPLRRVNEKAGEGVPGMSFRGATMGLVKISYVLVPLAVILTAIGIVM
jgi:hypothetical protein